MQRPTPKNRACLLRYRPNCVLEFPRGGSQAMVDALVRGLEKHGGRLLLSSHVEEVLLAGGRAAGEPACCRHGLCNTCNTHWMCCRTYAVGQLSRGSATVTPPAAVCRATQA